MPGETAFPTQPIPVKPPPLARVSYKPEDLVTAADTTPEHAKACAELVEKIGGVDNAGPFTPWPYRAEGAPPSDHARFPGRPRRRELGRNGVRSRTGFVFVVTQDVGALGWVEKAKEGSPRSLRQEHTGALGRARHLRCPRSATRTGRARNRRGAA